MGLFRKILNAAGATVNPATEDKQDDNISALVDLLTGIVLAAGSNNIGGVEIVDPSDNTRRAELDSITKYLVVIQEPHHNIHEEKHFFYSDCITLASSATQNYLITIPDDEIRKHFTFEVNGSAGITIAFFEGADRAGTTPQILYNNDRDSVNTPGLTVHKGTSGGSTDGVDIHPDCGGSSTGVGSTGVSKRENEIDLKTDTKYLMRVTSGANGNNIAVHFDWYERADE